MNILLSAFACRPNYGSEPGVGWNFAVELAKTHQVYVATRDSNRQPIEHYKSQENLPENITFLYYGLPTWIGFRDTESFLIHIYYFLWQIGLYFKAKKWIAAYNIDLIHHITYGVFRIPSFLAFLGKPFIFGPLGGGESYPLRLAKKLPRRHVLVDLLRNVINQVSVLNPLLLLSYRHSTLIVCKTNETLMKIPSRFHDRCIVSMEIGLGSIPEVPDTPPADGFKLLFVGRLIYWKGPHLVLKAFAPLVKQHPDCHLTMVGSGSDKAWLSAIAQELGIYAEINWIERVDQQQLFTMYPNYDFMLFPSLRDSSGNVVMEALAHRLPVLCLDLGGPCQIADPSCGVIIDTEHKNEEEVVRDITRALSELYEDRNLLLQKRSEAQNHVRYHLINKVVNRIYEHPILQEKLRP